MFLLEVPNIIHKFAMIMDNFAVKKVRLERLDVLTIYKNSSGVVFRSS